jgi:hypothetical protein
MQRKEALVCCQGMIDNPDHWLTAVRRFAVAIVLKISYGLEVDGPSSRWIRLAENAANAVGKSGAPASSIMDRFPASKDSCCSVSLSVQEDSNQTVIHSSLFPGLASVHGEAAVRPHLEICH